MSTPTPAAVTKKLDSIINGHLLVNLWSRWQDESEYEDIKDYGEALAKQYKCTVHKCVKRPFSFVISFIEFPDARYVVKCGSRDASWRRTA